MLRLLLPSAKTDTLSTARLPYMPGSPGMAARRVLAGCANLCYATAVQEKHLLRLSHPYALREAPRIWHYDVSSRSIVCQSHPHAAAVHAGEGSASRCHRPVPA